LSYRTALPRRNVAAYLAVITAFATACSGGSSSEPPAPTPAPAPSTGNLPALTLARTFAALSFSSPVAMLQAPGDNARWFVLERGGRVVVFPNNDAATSAQVTEFIRITVDARGEGGLLGMAFHPNFPATPHVFLSYTRTGNPLTSVIDRYSSNDGGATLDPATRVEILTLEQPFDNHKGGHIAFDRAGKLYIGFGDGGSGNDPQNNGQNLNALLGKILRIDIDALPAAGKNYAIPSDNPFAAGGGAPEIYASGFRNPWRWSFDRDTGRLWLGDVGQSAWEEVDIVTRGGNYGWRVCEGVHLRGSIAPCNSAAFIDPVAEYDHAAGCSITGGYVYRGASIPALTGVYLYGDFCAGTIWALRETTGATQAAINSGLSVVSFAESSDGELYVVDLNGTLHRIVPAS
jgi:glucose/arabinose dehydrogenase